MVHRAHLNSAFYILTVTEVRNINISSRSTHSPVNIKVKRKKTHTHTHKFAFPYIYEKKKYNQLTLSSNVTALYQLLALMQLLRPTYKCAAYCPQQVDTCIS